MYTDAKKHTVVKKHTDTMNNSGVKTLAGAQCMGTVHIYVCTVYSVNNYKTTHI